ncbi:MAG TPA: DUF2207 domain-containing protein [Vitreimonas sp.]|uniref:DUF2207 domain-containing protein n=1 Tax=Vitreimonas sp. TaxID=3069702 RepID=UPI002D4DD7B8|nr:DUF2207 domain-containing protein [Vitreimonas sp.]HYD88629.1 DUF2207 domain-containing protein [Vitreimonas sp.]
MTFRAALLALLALLFAAPALAREQINMFDVRIEVQTDGDIVVTETINVIAEGAQIQRGIFRDLPRTYELDGAVLPYDYDVLEVQRDGSDEPYETSTDDNAFRIRIGDPDVYLEPGAHTFTIRYEVANQVRYFDGYDEIYWNATGNYWAFPILRARAVVALPPGARITGVRGYTGALGQAGTAYEHRQSGDQHSFVTTRTLQPQEGLTVAVGFEKGLIDPPSTGDQFARWWQRNGALIILGLGLAGLIVFLTNSFNKVGRDPTRGPVFPRYEPPAGYSPAATHHIYYRAVSGHRALIATLMNLAVKDRLSIDASDKENTTLTRRTEGASAANIPQEDLALENAIFSTGRTKTLGAKYDSAFTAAYNAFNAALGRKYGASYFRWNIGYTLAAIGLTAIIIAVAATQVTQWTLWHTLGIIALILLNGVFLYLMPAPTQKGQQVRTEIEGFRLYMEKAEKLQLNAVEVGLEQPPPMTVERYERFLPFAVALGVEAPWTRHFERLIPDEAARYDPHWTTMSGSRSLGALTGALVANMSSGVSSALPQSSSSSGSGGGGSSGGGGGGGGGGGW